MSHPLTERTKLLIELIGEPKIQTQIINLFEDDGALYGPPTVEVLERVRFSVIKLAMEGPEMFKIATDLFKKDTRDLLMNAGFGNSVTEHEAWCEEIFAKNNV